MPTAKRRHIESTTTSIDFRLNDALLCEEFIAKFHAAWCDADASSSAAENVRTDFDSAGTTLRKYPFTLAVVAAFVQNQNDCIAALTDEIINAVSWTRKSMDLYAFSQSADLASFGTAGAPLLRRFHALLTDTVRPLLERLSGLRLTTVSASCSMYTAGDRLLVHDDRLTDRRIAYVFYASPWPTAADWTADMGGALELFAADANAEPQHPVAERLRPRNNQFVFFRVGRRSFHQVGEVASLEFPRLTINGWFHGPAPAADDGTDADAGHAGDTNAAPILSPNGDALLLGDWIRDTYLTKATKRSIQNAIEDQSETSLQRFFGAEFYAACTEQLKSPAAESLWLPVGPANRRHYDRLQVEHASAFTGPVRDLVRLLQSRVFFQLLFEYTELDLAGAKARKPSVQLELLRIGRESYSMLDDASARAEDTLDLVLYFGADDGDASLANMGNDGGSTVGTITYLNPEGDDEEDEQDESDDDEAQGTSSSVLLQVTPRDNTLNLVYRCQGTAKFLNYVSKRNAMRAEFVYMLVASYRE